MAMNTVIMTNVMALTAHRNLGSVGNKQNKANKRLSSGKKINSASDDAAGLAISEKMKAQIKGLDMATKNSEDAISLIQTAEGSLSEVNNMLNRVRELTVQAANDTNQHEDRVKIAEEVAQLLNEIDSTSFKTNFNERALNDGYFKNGHFQIGSNGGQSLNLSIANTSVTSIGANTIMDAYGIEKKVTLNTKSNVHGVVKEGKPANINFNLEDVEFKKQPGNTPADANKYLTTATVTIKYKEHGIDKVDNVKINLSHLKTDRNGKVDKGELGKAVSSQLNNSEIKDKFKFRDDSKGNLVIDTAKNGGEIKFSVDPSDLSFSFEPLQGGKSVGSATATSGNPATSGMPVEGYHNYIDVTNMTEGDTITLAGRTFTKVPLSQIGEYSNGFSTTDELRLLLKEVGIESQLRFNNTIQLDIIRPINDLEGNYKVDKRDVSNESKDFSNLLEGIDDALKTVTIQRSELGSTQNRLEYTINNLNLSSENLTAANSRIEDADMAKEMMNMTSSNVLQQAATTILAQANQAPKNITQLSK